MSSDPIGSNGRRAGKVQIGRKVRCRRKAASRISTVDVAVDGKIAGRSA
jgi:hypothetical protein